MPRYVAFLRAINVGGHTVKMDELRKLFDSLGLSGVETFIASGNVIFDAPARSTAALEQRIERGLADALGYAVTTFLRTPAELAAIAGARAPDDGVLYVGFLKAPPTAEVARRLEAMCTSTDHFRVEGRELYWRLRTKLMESINTGASLERALGQPMTMRNVTTVVRLAEKYASAP